MANQQSEIFTDEYMSLLRTARSALEEAGQYLKGSSVDSRFNRNETMILFLRTDTLIERVDGELQDAS